MMNKQPTKESYSEYRKERTRREEEVKKLWDKYRKLKREIHEAEQKLHEDYPETAGEDPGY